MITMAAVNRDAKDAPEKASTIYKSEHLEIVAVCQESQILPDPTSFNELKVRFELKSLNPAFSVKLESLSLKASATKGQASNFTVYWKDSQSPVLPVTIADPIGETFRTPDYIWLWRAPNAPIDSQTKGTITVSVKYSLVPSKPPAEMGAPTEVTDVKLSANPPLV